MADTLYRAAITETTSPVTITTRDTGTGGTEHPCVVIETDGGTATIPVSDYGALRPSLIDAFNSLVDAFDEAARTGGWRDAA